MGVKRGTTHFSCRVFRGLQYCLMHTVLHFWSRVWWIWDSIPFCPQTNGFETKILKNYGAFWDLLWILLGLTQVPVPTDNRTLCARLIFAHWSYMEKRMHQFCSQNPFVGSQNRDDLLLAKPKGRVWISCTTSKKINPSRSSWWLTGYSASSCTPFADWKLHPLYKQT